MLLDLLGGADPLITNHFDNTARWFDRLVAAGESLSDQTASDVPLHVASTLPLRVSVAQRKGSTGRVF